MAHTKEQARDELLSYVRNYCAYWAREGKSPKDMCEGLAFSILNIFDGTAGMLPAFDIVCRPHPDDNGHPFVDGMVINDDCQLHELFVQADATAGRG